MNHQNHLPPRKFKSKACENKLNFFHKTKNQCVAILHLLTNILLCQSNNSETNHPEIFFKKLNI